VQGLEEELLVEECAGGCGRVCRQLFYLSISEGRVKEASGYFTTFTYSRIEMGADIYRFYYESTEDEEG